MYAVIDSPSWGAPWLLVHGVYDSLANAVLRRGTLPGLLIVEGPAFLAGTKFASVTVQDALLSKVWTEVR